MDRKRSETPLLIVDLGEARERIHDALEFLHRYDGMARVDLDFNKAFGATDTLLDMEEALLALEHCEWPSDLGLAYLLTFGALQALVVQQDATQHLCEVFGLKFRPHNYPELLNIRDIRIRTAGHPSRHGRDGRRARKGEEEGSTFLVRRPFTKEAAPVVTYFDGPSGREAKDINLGELYAAQQRSLCSILRLIWTKILVDYPDAALFRWQPWQAYETYPGRQILIKVD